MFMAAFFAWLEILSYFLTVALPAATAVFIPVLSVWIFHKYRNYSPFGLLAVCFFFIGVLVLVIDAILNYHLPEYDQTFIWFFETWSVITFILCSLVVAPFLIVIEKNKKLKEYITKRLNF